MSGPEGYIDQSGDCDDLESYAHPLAIKSVMALTTIVTKRSTSKI